MFEIVFYEDENGYSELNEQLLELAEQSTKNKDARIKFKQITYSIELLKNYGTTFPGNTMKHLQGEIWELRPGVNRVLFFYYQNNTFVLLHMFRKKTQKTPKQELEKAMKEINDYKSREKGGDDK